MMCVSGRRSSAAAERDGRPSRFFMFPKRLLPLTPCRDDGKMSKEQAPVPRVREDGANVDHKKDPPCTGGGRKVPSMKKYIAEGIGTAVLVILGCGTAMLVGCDAASGSGYLLTALAFGLTIVAMAYSIGNISGCHINPAVSLAVWMSGGMKTNDFIGYVISQVAGAIVGSGLLAVIFALAGITDQTGGYGSNGLAGVNDNLFAGLLGVTAKKAGHGSFGGLVIGLSLTVVHILGIGLTGTSVNPARSIGPAIFAAITGNFTPLIQLWVFLVGPLAGAALAAFVYRQLEKK